MSAWSSIRDVITFLLALFGAVLSVVNTFSAWQQKQLRLIVEARFAYAFSDSGDVKRKCASIVVTNKSEFPIFVAEIGFELLGSSTRLAIPTPMTSDGLPFYRKLESRQSRTGYIEIPSSRKGVAGRCYVKTDGGEQVFGNMLGSK